jgi:putative drug exporter of the RND superfamily
VIMTGVFAAFAITDMLTTRQIGIGLAVAVLLDATLVRLVLLPAAMRLCGDATWWLPGPIGRVLPERREPAPAE